VSTNLGRKRGGNAAALTDERLIELERQAQQIESRRLRREPAYVSRRITKGSHGWSIGDWVKLDSGTWSKATAAATFSADLVGMVLRVIDTDHVEVVFEGYVRPPSLSYTVGSRYWLSTSAGVATSTKPTAPTLAMQMFVALDDKWLLILGPAARSDTGSLALADLIDVDSASLALAADGDLLTYDFATSKWKAAAGGTSSLGPRAATSVIGRAANTVGTAADIAASTTGDVLYMGASSLTWGPLGTASYQAGSVTAAKLGSDVVLDTLNDVTIAAVAALNFLRYDSGTAQWKNYDLGPLIWASATREFALDGGGGASAASVVGIGKGGSRFYVTSGTGLDFGLSGSVALGTDINARIRSTAASDVSFYDQATSTFGAGDKVMEWGTSATPGNRYFRFLMPIQVHDTGTKDLVIAGPSSQTWTIGDNVTPFTFMTFYGASADAFGARIGIHGTIDAGGTTGLTIYGDRSNGTSSSRLNVGATDGQWFQSGNLSLSATTALTLVGTGGGVQIAAATSEKVGFWGRTPVTKTTVADPAAITTTQTAGGTYGANEQSMLAALKADVIALRATLLNVTDAGQAVGLF
jgi:hypothetical protein